MVNNIFLEGVACFINIVNAHFGIIGVDFTPTFVNRHEHWFYSGGGAGHKACGACGGDGEAGYVAAPLFCHSLIHGGVFLSEAVQERVVLFPFMVEHLESSSLSGHVDR